MRQIIGSGKSINSKLTKTTNIEKGRETRFYFEKVLNFDYCLLLFSIMNVFLGVLYSDADYKGKEIIAKWCLYLMFGILVIESI